MIRIEKNKQNTCIFTLNEYTTITDAKYIINFHSNQNNTDKLMFLNNNISPNKNRFDKFIIEENDTEDLNNNIISLQATSYDYYVYETDSFTLSLDFVGQQVEKGKVEVIGEDTIITTFESDDDTHTFI